MPLESDVWQAETRSEAVYLDLVSPDATQGFVLRICRFPEAGIAWNWMHLFHHGHVHSYTHHELPCSSEFVDVDSDSGAVYSVGPFSLSRSGNRLAPGWVSASAEALMHAGIDWDHGDGITPASVTASFEQGIEAVRSLPGRSELLGTTTAQVTLGDATFELIGRGHFHEQLQERPRFTVPFTYGSLRGEETGLVFTRGARGASGALTLRGKTENITAVRINEPGSLRRFDIVTDQGEHRGQVFAEYQYEIPIFHMMRPGTVVTGQIDDVPVSGCINDLVFGDLTFDKL